MNTSTGDMITKIEFENLKTLNPAAANFYKLIPDSLLPELAGLNRKQRREWYRKNKQRIKEAV